MKDPTDATTFWKSILQDLKLRLTKATFDTWLSRTRALSLQDDHLAIEVPDPMTGDWLANRLHRPIAQALRRSAGQEITIAYISPPAPNTPPADDVPIQLQLIHHDPRDAGFVMTSNYAIQFWQPLMGEDPWCLWLTLRSYAWDAKRTAWPSISTLADIATNGNRHRIIGRAPRNGRGEVKGALEVLESLGLLKVTLRGSGRRTQYSFRVLDRLPLLTPGRVKQLSPHLRRAHRNYLLRAKVQTHMSGT